MLRVYRVSGGTHAPHPLAVEDVTSVLLSGGLVLLPTETVYGVGVAVGAYAGTDSRAACMPAAGSGYRRIFSLKGRDLDQTVPWLVAGTEDIARYGEDAGPQAVALAKAFWPGALTIVVKASRSVPPFMQAADGTVALRVSASPVVAALIRAVGSPLAVTSANTHGSPAPASFGEVEPRILRGVDAAIDGGATRDRVASTIVSFAMGSPDVIREGAISRAQIEDALDAVA